MARGSTRGSATVEHAGLCLLIAILAITGIALAAPPSVSGRELGFALARKLRCAAQGPGPCWQDPLTEAYGRALAGAIRARAPAPLALPGPDGAARLPVDFRRCRSAACAALGRRYGLTAANRRVTTFVAAAEHGGGATIDYREYRPGLAWVRRRVELAAGEVARFASTPLLDEQVPVLVALETLAGANHFRFAAIEEPPWRWQIERSSD